MSQVSLCGSLYQNRAQFVAVQSGYSCIGSLGDVIRCRLIFPIKIRDLSLDARLCLVLRAGGSVFCVWKSCNVNVFGSGGLLRQGKDHLRFFAVGGLSMDDSLFRASRVTCAGDLYLARPFHTEKNYDLYQRGCVTPVSWPIGAFLDGLQQEEAIPHCHGDDPINEIQFPVFASGNSSLSLQGPTSVLFACGRYIPESAKSSVVGFSSYQDEHTRQAFFDSDRAVLQTHVNTPIGKSVDSFLCGPSVPSRHKFHRIAGAQFGKESASQIHWFSSAVGWGAANRSDQQASNSTLPPPNNCHQSSHPILAASEILGALSPHVDYVEGNAHKGGCKACPVRLFDQAGWYVFVDRDADHEHPAAIKYMKLERRQVALLRGSVAHERPNAEEMQTLTNIINRPRPYHLTSEERHLLLRFRYSLQERKDALTKFLFAVDWQDSEETQVAIDMLDRWVPVEIDIALELLSADFQRVPQVRRYAVQQLEIAATEDDLRLYLLQLVQALRYEDPSGPSGSAALTNFLIRQAVKSRPLANYLYWYVRAEADENGGVFDQVLSLFLDVLGRQNPSFKTVLRRQRQMRRRFQSALNSAKSARRQAIDKKISIFQSELKASGSSNDVAHEPVSDELDLTNLPMLPLPVDPDVLLKRIVIDDCFMLKSAMYPAVFKCNVLKNRSISNNDVGKLSLGSASPNAQPSSSPSTKSQHNGFQAEDWVECDKMYMLEISKFNIIIYYLLN